MAYAPTELYVNDSQINTAREVKDLKVLRVCADIIDAYEAICREHYFEIAAMDHANDVRDFVVRKSQPFRLNFWTYADQVIRQRRETGHAKTAECMQRSVNAFRDYLRVQPLDITTITPSMIRQFLIHLQTPRRVCRRDQFGILQVQRHDALCESSAKAYAVDLRTIFNEARAEYNADDLRIKNDPFLGVNLSRRANGSGGSRALEVEDVVRIFHAHPIDKLQALARDVFCISFALCGVNIADLYAMPPLVDGRAEYCRVKTAGRRADNAFISVAVPDDVAKEVYDYRARLSSAYAFRFRELYKSKDGFLRAVNDGLHALAKSLGMRDITTYYARQSWATIARNVCNIDIADISMALNHVAENRVTDRYIKPDFSRIDNANRRVLDAIKGAIILPRSAK